MYSQSQTAIHLHYALKMLGCFNATLGQIWTNPNVLTPKKFNTMAGVVHI